MDMSKNDAGAPRTTPSLRYVKNAASQTFSLTRLATATVRGAARVPLQARHVSRTVPRLPDAAGRHGIATTIARKGSATAQIAAPHPDSPHAYHLLVLGDSVAAGVGLEHHRSSIAGRLASMLSEGCGHPVAWHVFATSGADAHDCETATHETEFADRLGTCDAVVVSVGVNDVLAPRTRAAYRRDLTALITRLTDVNPTVPIVLLGVPPLNLFPAMPQELGRVLGRRAQRFDEVSVEVASLFPTVHHLPLADPELSMDNAFADDGFHPSAKMHKRIAKRADRILREAREAGFARQQLEARGKPAPSNPSPQPGSARPDVA